MSRYLNNILFSIIAALALTACGTVSTDPGVIETAQKLLEEQKNEFGEPLKINFPIQLHYTVRKKPQVRHDLLINLEFIAERLWKIEGIVVAST